MGLIYFSENKSATFSAGFSADRTNVAHTGFLTQREVNRPSLVDVRLTVFDAKQTSRTIVLYRSENDFAPCFSGLYS